MLQELEFYSLQWFLIWEQSHLLVYTFFFEFCNLSIECHCREVSCQSKTSNLVSDLPSAPLTEVSFHIFEDLKGICMLPKTQSALGTQVVSSFFLVNLSFIVVLVLLLLLSSSLFLVVEVYSSRRLIIFIS